jgi:putative transposase
MKAHEAEFPIATMCRVLGVSRSGYDAWLSRTPSAHVRQDAVLTRRIQQIRQRSRGTYGAPRIHAKLAAAGVQIGRKRVARLMKAAELAGVSRRQRVRTTRRQPAARAASDLVKRDCRASGPNELWVADITYMPTWAGFDFLAVVVYAWSRRVVGWAMADHLRTKLVLDALEMALQPSRPLAVFTTATRAVNILALPSASAVGELACDPPWRRSAIVSMMPCVRAFSLLWSANSWIAEPFAHAPRSG